jgi:FkbM family methyltransferase
MGANRSFWQILSAVVQKRHYVALRNMYRNYPAFGANLGRYILGIGTYPYNIQIVTPLGIVRPTLYSYHDLLSVNEIFCRLDYFADASVEVVVDFGANIGISALYFMTRNRDSRCYLFEPDPKNVEKLRKNLVGFESRYSLREEAVSDESGLVQFGIESTGRYGGIEVEADTYIEVNCVNVNDILADIFMKEERIDILKIDTEGVEIKTVHAINETFLPRIGRIYLEAKPEDRLGSRVFEQHQYGSVCQLTNRMLLDKHNSQMV